MVPPTNGTARRPEGELKVSMPRRQTARQAGRSAGDDTGCALGETSMFDNSRKLEIDTQASILPMLEDAMQRHADKPAFRCFGRTLTFADTDRLSRAFAAFLQHKLAVTKGQRIAVMMPNIPAFP